MRDTEYIFFFKITSSFFCTMTRLIHYSMATYYIKPITIISLFVYKKQFLIKSTQYNN